jgi:hypothetical protein
VLANYGASEAVNLCSWHVEKSTKCSEQKMRQLFFREYNLLQSSHRMCKFFRPSQYLCFFILHSFRTSRRKIRLILGNAKCRHLKKLVDLEMDFMAGVYLSEAQKPIPPPLPITHCLLAYSTIYLFTQGRGVGLNQREN